MVLPLVMLLCVSCAIVIPVLIVQATKPLPAVNSMRDFDGLGVPSEWADQALFHLPIIDTMREQWPAIDIVEYDSATAPGYHALMATLLRLISGESGGAITPILILNLLIGLAMISVAYVFCARVAGPWPAAAMCMPIAANAYILSGTAFLTTDNLAWLFTASALGLAAFAGARSTRLFSAGVFCMLAVSVRQIMIWAAGPVVLAGMLASPLVRLVPSAILQEPGTSRRDGHQPRWRPLVFACLGAGMAFVLLGLFVFLWGGLLPKASELVHSHSAGPNLATPAFMLALIGFCGVFLLPLVWHDLLRFLKRPFADLPALIAMSFGLLCAIAVQTSSTIDQPRDTQLWKARAYGWLWQIVRRTPDIAERSIVIAAGAAAGAIGLLLLWRGARRVGHARPALILLIALLAFTCAQTLNTMAWQRYFEPIVLIVLAWFGALIWKETWQAAPKLRRCFMAAAPLLLGTMMLALSTLSLLLPMVRYLTN